MDEKTIRAMLAGHALQGFLSNRWRDMPHETSKAQIAAEAVRWADTLLVELKKDSPAPAEDCPPPPHDTAVAGDVVSRFQKEGAGSGPQSGEVLSPDEGSRAGSPSNGGENPRRPSAGNGADNGRSAASPDVTEETVIGEDGVAVARWGRADGMGAWHLWREGFSESECEDETSDGEIAYSEPETENACLACAALVGWEAPEAQLQPARPAIVKHRCAGFNKAARVDCNSASVHVERGGKWFCKRHDPEKPKKLRPVQEVAA